MQDQLMMSRGEDILVVHEFDLLEFSLKYKKKAKMFCWYIHLLEHSHIILTMSCIHVIVARP